MFRRLILAIGATAVIGVAALTPTVASAHYWHGHYWFGGGFYPIHYGGPDCHIVKQVYWTTSGKHVRHVQVCD